MLSSAVRWRELWITDRLATQIYDNADPQIAHRTGLLMADVDRFVSNGVIEVSSGRRNEGFLKLLDPEENQIWTLRSQSPSPGIRLFGRFAAQDIFVATNLEFRKELQGYGSDEFEAAIDRCQVEWVRCLGNVQPLQGRSINDYIRENAVECSDFR
jgi:hypothetical protein